MSYTVFVQSLCIDSTMRDDERRRRVFEGEVFAFSQTQTIHTLVEFTRDLTDEAFAPLDPRRASRLVPAARHASILEDLGARLTHHPRTKALVRDVLDSSHCDLDRTFFSPPQLSFTVGREALAPGWREAVAYRDTGRGAPSSQVSWWLPVYAVEPETTIAFHLASWARARECDRNALEPAREAHGCGDDRPGERFGIPTDGSAGSGRHGSPYRITISPGGAVAYSSAHLHSVGAPPASATIAVCFGTVHLDDLRSMNGAPTIDGRSVHPALSGYRCARDFEPLPEEVRALYMGGGSHRPPSLAIGSGAAWLDPLPVHGSPARRVNRFTPTA